MTAAITLGSLLPHHRRNVARIVRSTGVFSDDEVAVALELVDRGESEGYEFVAAMDEADDLLGYACFGATPMTDATFDIYWIAVDPAVQGQGVGAQLMAEVEHGLSRRGGRLVVVETSSRDLYAPTRRFYDRLGYSQSARVRDFYAPGDDRIVFTKRLAGPMSDTFPLPVSRI